MSTAKHISIQTTDGVTIVGDWDSVAGAKKAVLLLHMMPATRSSWEMLSAELNKNNFSTLAIDLRGHGESTQQKVVPQKRDVNGLASLTLGLGDKKLDYKNFNDIEHQASRLDVDAALNFLKIQGFAEENISIVGASIGANLVADAMYRYAKIVRGVLLSPGLDFRAIRTVPAVKNLVPTQKMWIVASHGDEYSAQSAQTLQQTKPENITISILDGGDHGTNMFNSQKTLIADIAKFLKS